MFKKIKIKIKKKFKIIKNKIIIFKEYRSYKKYNKALEKFEYESKFPLDKSGEDIIKMYHLDKYPPYMNQLPIMLKRYNRYTKLTFRPTLKLRIKTLINRFIKKVKNVTRKK